jgi:hypothetical protein
MLAKGNRSKAVTKACKKHGGFYLGSIGGPAAILAQNCIKKMEARLAPPPASAARYASLLRVGWEGLRYTCHTRSLCALCVRVMTTASVGHRITGGGL